MHSKANYSGTDYNRKIASAAATDANRWSIMISNRCPTTSVAAIFVKIQMPQTNFCCLYLLRLHVKFSFDWSRGFWKEDIWRVWTRDGQTNEWMTEPAYTKSSPKSLKGSGELKIIRMLSALFCLVEIENLSPFFRTGFGWFVLS